MHEIVLRIFFSGLMAFVPAKDGKELTVLLVNATHDMKLADGSTLPHHTPMLLARAANCAPAPCTVDAAVAKFLFPDVSPGKAADALAKAIAGGGAWPLSNVDVSLATADGPLEIRTTARRRTAAGAPDPVPMTPAERADFSWVPHLTAIVPGIGELKPELLGPHPPSSLVAARFHLRSGSVITYSMIRVDEKVRPIEFRVSDKGNAVPYAQALANWVEAEIHVSADAIDLVTTNFDTGAASTVKLRPQGDVVELAVLNLQSFTRPNPKAKAPLPKPGQHFEVYYDLMTAPPPHGQRPIPRLPATLKASDPQVDWIAVHPQNERSDLLDALEMNPRGKRKSSYDLSLCPGSQIP